jgi:hypothetical protein
MPKATIYTLRQDPEFRTCIMQFKRVEPWAVIPLLKRVERVLREHGMHGNPSYCEVHVRIALGNRAEEQELDRAVLHLNEEQIKIDDMDWERFNE